MKTISHFDVIIVGGGLVGLTLACLLLKRDLRVALVETGEIGPPQLPLNDYMLRVSALNLSCKEMFNDLNVWQKITATGRVAPYEKMYVWDECGKGEIEFNCTHIAQSCLGYIVENAIINQALIQEIECDPGITFFANSNPVSISLEGKKIQLQIIPVQSKTGHKTITADLIVGADGANSWVREFAYIESYFWPYHHDALVTTVRTDYSHQKTAWQCFLPNGPLALLPLYDENICSVVWSSSPSEIQQLQALDQVDFDRKITNAFSYKLGNLTKIGNHASFSLNMRHAKRYTAQRVALIGDAAHTIHPLAGQGVNLGFADACSLAGYVYQAKLQYNDCGDYRFLRQYERDRKGDNWVMIFGMEFFKRLFSNQSLLLSKLRSMGLGLVNKSDLIKNQFIYRAIGR